MRRRTSGSLCCAAACRSPSTAGGPMAWSALFAASRSPNFLLPSCWISRLISAASGGFGGLVCCFGCGGCAQAECSHGPITKSTIEARSWNRTGTRRSEDRNEARGIEPPRGLHALLPRRRLSNCRVYRGRDAVQESFPNRIKTWFRKRNHLRLHQLPAPAVGTVQIARRRGRVLHLARFAVPFDLLTAVISDVAQQHGLRQRAAVGEIAGSRAAVLDRFQPFAVMADRRWDCRLWRRELFEIGLWEQFVLTIIGHKFALVAFEEHAGTVAGILRFAGEIGTGDAAVPREVDRRQLAAGGVFVIDLKQVWYVLIAAASLLARRRDSVRAAE